MNKMGTISAIRERIIGIITKEVNKTEKEIADFEEKVSDNLYYYGEGGSRIMKKGDSYIQLTENGKVVEK